MWKRRKEKVSWEKSRRKRRKMCMNEGRRRII
jgi:hypothetical protein